MKYRKKFIAGVVALSLLVIAGCAPGNAKFEVSPAGFWAGLWHGLICVMTFIISLFTQSVRMYEVNNTGALYNLGFLLGVACFFGGSWRSHRKKKQKKSAREREWEEIGVKVEEKIRKGIQSWLDESEGDDKEWEEIGKKIEEKIKRELRNWAEN